MKKYIIFGVALLANMAWLGQAHAGIYLEPYLGYAMGTSEGSIDISGFGTVTIDDEDTGTVIGGKVGYSMLGLAFGADYAMFDIDSEESDGEETSSDVTALGAFVQYTFPILIKVSATYILDASIESESSEGSGSGYKIGVGYTGLPFISINFDLISINYDELTATGLTITSADITADYKMLSVSLPFDL